MNSVEGIEYGQLCPRQQGAGEDLALKIDFCHSVLELRWVVVMQMSEEEIERWHLDGPAIHDLLASSLACRQG